MGPPPDNCQQILEATLILKKGEQGIGLEQVIHLGLDWAGIVSPVDHLQTRLEACGFRQGGEADAWREWKGIQIPSGRLFCRTFKDAAFTPPVAQELGDVDLIQACLILGLCSEFVYETARPPIWTTLRLTRSITLCRPVGYHQLVKTEEKTA